MGLKKPSLFSGVELGGMPWLPGVLVGIIGASGLDQKSRADGVAVENLGSY